MAQLLAAINTASSDQEFVLKRLADVRSEIRILNTAVKRLEAELAKCKAGEGFRTPAAARAERSTKALAAAGAHGRAEGAADLSRRLARVDLGNAVRSLDAAATTLRRVASDPKVPAATRAQVALLAKKVAAAAGAVKHLSATIAATRKASLAASLAYKKSLQDLARCRAAGG